ncbi:hypothetical protein O6H91_20G066700 [Diphasiastrum complanatum]|uniref:Uncharacterized protein n=1 Tax=Diphasiastrum complanatum TaxID=34168 RepID=A0ACC2ARL7_DIPCM|nr:hypothetical protein O6H91_20G066700 [Diphasiastrum complanatum]
MVFTSRMSFCYGLLVLCLLFFPNLQSAKGRVLEGKNNQQFRKVTTQGEQQIQAPIEVVSSVGWLKINLWKNGKFHKSHVHEKTEAGSGANPGRNHFPLQSASQSGKAKVPIWDSSQEIGLQSSKINGYAEKLILNAQLLPKGGTPPPGPNHGHNGVILVADHKLGSQSLPKSPTTPSRPNPSHNFVTESENGEKVHLESMPKGPSGPSPGQNVAIFPAKEAAAARDELIFNSRPQESTLAHDAAKSAKANSRDDEMIVLNKIPKNPAQSSSASLSQYPTHTTASQKPDNNREISELSSDSRRKLSELIGCQQDFMPFYQNDQLAPATPFKHASMQHAIYA